MGRSVAGVLVRDGKAFVGRRAPGGAMGSRWEFPGGKVEEGESDQEALVREFLEEFDAQVRAIKPLGETSFLHHGRTRVLAAWLVELLPGSKLIPKEHVELRWMALSELRRLDLADSDRELLAFVDSIL